MVMLVTTSRNTKDFPNPRNIVGTSLTREHGHERPPWQSKKKLLEHLPHCIRLPRGAGIRKSARPLAAAWLFPNAAAGLTAELSSLEYQKPFGFLAEGFFLH